MRYEISRMPYPHITPRQWEILVMTSEGMSGPALANYLNISYGTIRNHKYSMYKRLGVHNAQDAIREAVKMGWLKEDSWSTL